MMGEIHWLLIMKRKVILILMFLFYLYDMNPKIAGQLTEGRRLYKKLRGYLFIVFKVQDRVSLGGKGTLTHASSHI